MPYALPSWYADQRQAAIRGLRGRSNKEVTLPRMPTDAERRYNTQHYTLYDYAHPNPGPRTARAFARHGIYDQYTLSSNQNIQNGTQLPAGQGVRLDDYHCYLAATQTDVTDLHNSFGSEFDVNRDIRATRMPMGLAAKVWRDVGDVDMDGQVVYPGEQGWYYLWWRGIHLLCGEEGWQAGMYRVRATWFDRGLPGKFCYAFGVFCIVDDPRMRGLIVSRCILLEEILQSGAATTILTQRTRFILR